MGLGRKEGPGGGGEKKTDVRTRGLTRIGLQGRR